MDIPPSELWEFIQNHLWVTVLSVLLGIIGYHGRWQKIRKLTKDDENYVTNIYMDFFVEAVLMTNLMAFVGLLIGSKLELDDTFKLLVVIVVTLRPREFLDVVSDTIAKVVTGGLGTAMKKKDDMKDDMKDKKKQSDGDKGGG